MSASSSERDVAAVLETRKLSRALGDKAVTLVLHDIDLRISRGEWVAVTGHSGSGKSTLLYLLGALDRPTAGSIWIDGVDVSRLDDRGRTKLRNEKLGFVFQFHFLLPEFDIAENVMIPMLRRGLRDIEARKRAIETLDTLGLADLAKRRPNEISGGQQQRVAIARAIANEPLVLLADEPTGNLDSRNGALVMDLFGKMNRESGTTIVMVTHDVGFAARASRRVTLTDGSVTHDERTEPGQSSTRTPEPL